MVKIPTRHYQQFDADYARPVPGEGFGGWRSAEVDLAPAHTAVVVMHAWECGAMAQWPGWRRCVEYHPRALQILREVFPPLLGAVRASPLPLFHVVGGRDYYSHLAGYRRTVKLAGPSPRYARVRKDPGYRQLEQFRADRVFVGRHNRPDVRRGFARLGFAPEARPRPGEPIAKDGHQLAALCRAHGINHLVYIGFALNWCLLMSPGGMIDLGRYGVLCSTIPEAVTAVENAATAREEREKAQALWRVSLNSGFIFGLTDFTRMLQGLPPRRPARRG